MTILSLLQTSAFGAFLDVWVDNLTRAYLWLTGLPLVWALPMVTLESTAFLCTHCAGGAAWKTGAFRGAPAWMRRCMSNNFRSLDGAFTVLGLMLCPLWFWANARLSTHGYTNPLALALILPGRLKALNLEVWVIFRYIHALMEQSVVRPAGSAAATGDAAGAAAQPAQAASEGRRLGVGATQLAEATSTLVKTQVTRLLKESLSKGQLSKIQVDAVRRVGAMADGASMQHAHC